MEKEVLDQDILQKQAREKYIISEKVSSYNLKGHHLEFKRLKSPNLNLLIKVLVTQCLGHKFIN